MDSSSVNKLITISGIIVSSSKSQIKTCDCYLQCRNCGNVKRIKVGSGFEQLQIPRMCDSAKNLPPESKEKCPLDSYMVVPDKCKYIDVQTLKIQEAPELIPVGEIPRTYLLYSDRYLVNKVTPGTRVTVIGIQCVDERKNQGSGSTEKGSYIRVIQFIPETKKTGRQVIKFTDADKAMFDKFAKDKDIYNKISRSIAPAIFGHEDIKKAIACLLFGGCRKRLNEGVNLR
ncbi:MAG: hypothetical protein MJ252_22885 [archaeon]|nr:hypothetical protein [archaeon]